jgi:hypothetical protein
MKSKDQQLLEEAYANINESHGKTITIEVPLELWKHALNAHNVPNTADVLAAIMGDIVNLHNEKNRAAEKESKDHEAYLNKLSSRSDEEREKEYE